MDTNEQILYLLGQIKAKQETQEQKQLEMDQKQDQINEKLDICLSRTAKVESVVERISPEVDDYTKMKHRGWGIVATIGVIGTVLGGFLVESIKKMF